MKYVCPGASTGYACSGAPTAKSINGPMLLVRATGPLLPEGSSGRKSHAKREIVTSLAVGGPPYSATLTTPGRVAVVLASGGIVNLTAQAPFQAKPGGSV